MLKLNVNPINDLSLIVFPKPLPGIHSDLELQVGRPLQGFYVDQP